MNFGETLFNVWSGKEIIWLLVQPFLTENRFQLTKTMKRNWKTLEKSPAHFVTNYSECLRCVTNDVIAWLSSCQCINFVAVQLQSRSSASNLLALCNGRWCVSVFTNIVLLVFRDLIWGMIMLNRGVLVLSLAFVCSTVAHPHSMYDEVAANMPAPFTRVLFLKKPPFEGKDVVILQNLLLRSPSVESVETTGFYDQKTSEAVTSYQRLNGLPG